MKLSLALLIAFIAQTRCHAQNAMNGPIGLYGIAYNASTTILNGGSIFVGNGGNWHLGGSVIGADKGNPNSPSPTGQSEVITFDGTGTISGGATTPGQTGNYINAYAATTGTSTTVMVLPIGGSSAVYPFTIPPGGAVKVAYFDGSGSTTSVPVNGIPTIEFSQYFDMPVGWPAAAPSLAYPAGLMPGFNAVLKSAAGTSFSLETNIPDLLFTANTVVSASLPTSTASRLYLSTSPVLLPIQLDYFHGTRQTDYNLLQWASGAAANIDHFQLYKHGNQSAAFIPIAQVPANDSLADYSFQDRSDTGSAYYQLALVGKDGSVTLSQIVFLPADDNTTTPVFIYPNPASSMLNVTLTSPGQTDLYCSIVDMKGQKIATRLIPVDGNATIQWDVSAFPKGIYMLNVRNAQTGKTQNIQFIKF